MNTFKIKLFYTIILLFCMSSYLAPDSYKITTKWLDHAHSKSLQARELYHNLGVFRS